MKKDIPLVSIVMPVYNAMPYLELAIKSIFAQTYRNWELIIVDDFSNDGSWEYICSINDDRIKRIRNDYNKGNSYTCNIGITKANGTLIAKMDSDDISYPERIEKQVQYLISNPEVVAVGCGAHKIYNENKVYLTSIPPQKHKDIFSLTKFKTIFLGPQIKVLDGALTGKIEWFKKFPYDENVLISQDFDRFYRSRNYNNISNVQEILYLYRKSGRTVSVKSKINSMKNKIKTIYKYGNGLKGYIELAFALTSFINRILIASITPLFIKINSKSGQNSKAINKIILTIKNTKLPINNE